MKVKELAIIILMTIILILLGTKVEATTGKINSVADLKGKKIYATGQGSTPEYILRYVLEKNGINPDKDVTIEFKSEHAELATLVQSGEAQIALLPEKQRKELQRRPLLRQLRNRLKRQLPRRKQQEEPLRKKQQQKYIFSSWAEKYIQKIF